MLFDPLFYVLFGPLLSLPLANPRRSTMPRPRRQDTTTRIADAEFSVLICTIVYELNRCAFCCATHTCTHAAYQIMLRTSLQCAESIAERTRCRRTTGALLVKATYDPAGRLNLGWNPAIRIATGHRR